MWTKTRVSCVQRKTQKFWTSFGDNLKQAAKDAKRSEKITTNDSYRKNFRVVNRQYSQNNPGKTFLGYGSKVVKTSIVHRQSRDHTLTATTTQ